MFGGSAQASLRPVASSWRVPSGAHAQLPVAAISGLLARFIHETDEQIAVARHRVVAPVRLALLPCAAIGALRRFRFKSVDAGALLADRVAMLDQDVHRAL